MCRGPQVCRRGVLLALPVRRRASRLPLCPKKKPSGRSDNRQKQHHSHPYGGLQPPSCARPRYLHQGNHRQDDRSGHDQSYKDVEWSKQIVQGLSRSS